MVTNQIMFLITCIVFFFLIKCDIVSVSVLVKLVPTFDIVMSHDRTVINRKGQFRFVPIYDLISAPMDASKFLHPSLKNKTIKKQFLIHANIKYSLASVKAHCLTHYYIPPIYFYMKTNGMSHVTTGFLNYIYIVRDVLFIPPYSFIFNEKNP